MCHEPDSENSEILQPSIKHRPERSRDGLLLHDILRRTAANRNSLEAAGIYQRVICGLRP